MDSKISIKKKKISPNLSLWLTSQRKFSFAISDGNILNEGLYYALGIKIQTR
jgi:hypothetical protein